MRSLIFVIGSLFFAGSALAADAIQIDVSLPTIAEQHRLVINTINNDAKYSEMTQADRATVESALLEITQMLSDGKSFGSLDPQSKQKVDLNQGEVNRLLAKAYRDSRLVCTKEAPIGSNMIKRVCKTAAARARDNEISRNNGTQVNQ